jgi:hypothetical protein
MCWFTKVENEEMMWSVDSDEALDALRQISSKPPYQKCVLAEGNGHTVVFFEGRVDGELWLMEASVATDGTLNTPPEKTMAGRVDNVFNFEEQWKDVSVSDSLPEAITD